MIHCVISDDNKVGLNKLIQMEHKKYSELLANHDYLQSKENEKSFDIDNKIPINLPVIHDAIL
jgi:hypothetical protein